ncbi:MAG: sigma-70 family RNA polymerase sigma factor [Candidatus Gastranaerophilaceae bacterium]
MPVEQKVNLKEYQNLIETVCKVEAQKMASTSHLLDFMEMMNIATQTLFVLFKQKTSDSYNHSYLSTAIKWSIRNEVRRRYKWYSMRQKQDIMSGEEVRESMYKTILSVEEMAEAENPTIIRSNDKTPEESMVFYQLKDKISELMKTLPEREKDFIEQRFFKDKKLREMAEEYQISPSRISRIIQSGLNRIKKELIKQEML